MKVADRAMVGAMRNLAERPRLGTPTRVGVTTWISDALPVGFSENSERPGGLVAPSDLLGARKPVAVTRPNDAERETIKLSL